MKNYKESDIRVITTENVADALLGEIKRLSPDKVFLLTDSRVVEMRPNEIRAIEGLLSTSPIVTPDGEAYKNITSLQEIWRALMEGGASRNSLLICMGGGTITDMGGFAAATFKRGMRFVNVPTTLLGAVDASVGGKTGIDFMGLKNSIGTFANACSVIVDVEFFTTLPRQEMLSGYAEVVKTAAITDGAWFYKLLDLEMIISNRPLLSETVARCIRSKMTVVKKDPTEKGYRKVLNFGHTYGHGYESLALADGCPIAHGVAVAHGMLDAMRISEELYGFRPEHRKSYQEFLERYYPALPESVREPERLLPVMLQDKKNRTPGKVSFTLLADLGVPVTDVEIRL